MTNYLASRYAVISLSVSIALFAHLFFSFSIAHAANEVTISEDTTLIMPSGGVEYSLLQHSKFDSLTINDSSFAFVMSAGGKATLKSQAGKIFTTTDINKSTVCNSNGTSLITIEVDPGDSDGKTITVTPSSNTCTSIEAGGSSSGGTGITGTTPSAPTIPAQTNLVTTAPTSRTASPPAPVSSVVFASDLTFGMQNADVTRLQILLASDKSIYPEGLVTGYFGLLTQKAVERFQVKYGIVSAGTSGTSGFGRLGPKTRIKLQEVFSGVSASSVISPIIPPPVVPVAISSFFTIGLGSGTTHPDIERLQKLLNTDPDTRIAEIGVGSPGNETNFFGSLTKRAVQKFQEKYGIAKEGEPGFGYVGPKTRAKLQNIFGSNQGAAEPTN